MLWLGRSVEGKQSRIINFGQISSPPSQLVFPTRLTRLISLLDFFEANIRARTRAP